MVFWKACVLRICGGEHLSDATRWRHVVHGIGVLLAVAYMNYKGAQRIQEKLQTAWPSPAVGEIRCRVDAALRVRLNWKPTLTLHGMDEGSRCFIEPYTSKDESG